MSAVKKAVITGGNGYIGSSLIQHALSLGVEVHALANRNQDRLKELLPTNNIHPFSGDLKFYSDIIRELQPDTIFHLASVHTEPHHFEDMMSMVDANLEMGTALLHGASRCEKPPAFINTGSYWQFTDSEVYSPKTFYAATKQAFHDLMMYFARLHTVPVMTLVLYDSFGRNDPRPKIWTKLLQAPFASRFPLTEGRQYIELVHVDDIVRAYFHAADLLHAGEGNEKSYAVRSEERITLRAMLERWHRNGGLDLEFDWGAVPYWEGQVFHPWRGEILPGWHPETDVHQVVGEWLREERDLRYGKDKRG